MVSVQNRAAKRAPISQAQITAISRGVLGSQYEVSVVLGDNPLLARLNKTYRGKSGTTNVLSFSLSKNSGEIFLNTTRIAAEAPDFDKTFKNHFIFILIHALLHLKGFTHGSTMDREEKKFVTRFSR